MADEQVPREEKTEEATPRRRQEARERGQVAQSKELLAACMLIASVLGMVLWGGPMVQRVGALAAGAVRGVTDLGVEDLTMPVAVAWMHSGFTAGLEGMLPLLLALLAVGAIVGYGQVGFLVTPKAIELELSKIDPVQGFKKLVGARSWVRTGMALAKIGVIGITMAVIAWSQIDELTNLAGAGLGPVLMGTGHVVFLCISGALVAILALALIDFLFQRFQHDRDLRMSKKELRDELKNTEGDPQVKARVRALQREMASRRMMADVPEATVVVTNPTHFAVALRYDRDAVEPGSTLAPRVVAKGADHVARRIREVAEESGVPLYEDPPLARALHAQVEIGEEVPVELYEAVAGVLAYVYRVHGMTVKA